MRYFIVLAYNGASYAGWQVQPNDVTIQGTLESALSLMLRSKISVVGCGRTDTGVHAKHYVAHFDAEINDVNKLTVKLNSYLPKDISVFKIVELHNSAHARFDAISRSYEYHITKHKDPFLNPLSYKLPFNPDFSLMNEAAKLLLHVNDFTSFAKLHGNAKTNLCNVTRADWVQESEQHWVFHISANRFLRNMVRAVVGTLLEVGKGKLSIDDFKKIIETKNRSSAGVSVPPQGLFLTDIKYPYTF